MAEPEAWEDAIDVDDSDLPSLLQPISIPIHPVSSSSILQTLPLTLRSCTQLRRPSQTLAPTPRSPSPSLEAEQEAAPPPPKPTAASALRLIPGPAGAVQAAMHRKAAVAENPRSRSELETQDAQIDDKMDEEDGDFKLNPWLLALHLLGLGSGSALPWPISSIKARNTTARVPQVVGIVNSCRQNGFGDLMVTLKDQTGMIGASIHRRVLKECNVAGDISVGCVLLLKQIAVFSVGRSACYLNVTSNNLVKLISKDCGPPLKQILPSVGVRRDPSGTEERASLVRQRAENAGDDVGRNLIYERMAFSGKDGLVGSSQCSIKAAAARNNTAAKTRTNAPEGANLVRQRDESAADEMGSAIKYANTSSGGEQIEIELLAVERKRNVRPRLETTADEARDLNYGTMRNNGKAGDGMEIELETEDEDPIVRLRADTTVTENIGYDKIISNVETELTGKVSSSIKAAAAATGNMAARSDFTREPRGTRLGGENIAPFLGQNKATAADNMAKMNLDGGKMMASQKTSPTGSLPCSISFTAIATNKSDKLDHGTSEPKNLISKLSVAQWTDEQLEELFSDYQDDSLLV